MTQNEIIRMMKEAGFYIGKDDEFEPAWERFAYLVAAHEREACAKVCEPFIGTDKIAQAERIQSAILARSNT